MQWCEMMLFTPRVLQFMSLRHNSQFRHVNHSEISESERSESDRFLWWRHIVPHNSLHKQEGVNLLSFMTFGESKCPGYLNFLWNYSQMHYSDVRWCTSKWTLGNRRQKMGGGYNTSSPISFHYPIFFIQSLTRKWHLLDIIFVVFSLSNELDEEYIETNCRNNVIHGLYIGGS